MGKSEGACCEQKAEEADAEFETLLQVSTEFCEELEEIHLCEYGKEFREREKG